MAWRSSGATNRDLIENLCRNSLIKDPRVKGVTVTRAEVSADLQHAKVYVSIMGTEKEQSLAMHGLKSAAGFVQTQVAERLTSRYVPHITIVLDEGVKKSIEIARLIREENERLAADARAAGRTDEPALDAPADDDEPGRRALEAGEAGGAPQSDDHARGEVSYGKRASTGMPIRSAPSRLSTSTRTANIKSTRSSLVCALRGVYSASCAIELTRPAKRRSGRLSLRISTRSPTRTRP